MPVTYSLIGSATVGSGGASSIDFTSIPATYTDLKIVASARSSAGTLTFGDISFNGSTASFTGRYIEGNGAAASSATDQARLAVSAPGSSATASTFGNSEIYIPNYAGSTNKSFSVDTTGENNATTSYMQLSAGLWSNTAAITSITITAQSSRTFVQYSNFYLYGIKNS